VSVAVGWSGIARRVVPADAAEEETDGEEAAAAGLYGYLYAD
jgi:hypothetical protein